MNNQTNNSLFTEIKQDEAAQVNGGAFSYAAYFLSRMNARRYRGSFLNRANASGFKTASGYALSLMRRRRR